MAAVGGGDNPPIGNGNLEQSANGFVGDMWMDAERQEETGSIGGSQISDSVVDDDTFDGEVKTGESDFREIGLMARKRHRPARSDTLESLDDPEPRQRTSMKTYEQLRSTFAEKGNANSTSSVEMRHSLCWSITADVRRHASSLCYKTIQRVRLCLSQRRGGGRAAIQNLLSKLPLLDTLRTYKREYVAADLASGLAEGIVVIPMGISYALLANLPPVYGLYTSIFPPLLYMLFGTCHQLSLGVSAIESLLVAEGVSNVIGWVGNEVGDQFGTTQEQIDTKVKVTVAFTMMVGLWHMVMRLFGVGLVATLLADPVLSGFSTASAFLIGTSQLKHLCGFDLPRGNLPEVWYAALSNIQNINIVALILGLSGILLLLVLKKANNKYLPKIPLPTQVLVVVLATLVTFIFSLHRGPSNIKILGVVPAGLPVPSFPTFPTVEGIGGISAYGSQFAVQSLLVAVMTYIITISIGKTFAAMNNNTYRINADQELVAMSVANLVGSVFQSYPASGSLSRTSVVQSVECKTRMHSLPAVILMTLVLVAITPLLYTLPTTILGSVVLFGVMKMINFQEARRLYHLNKPDFMLWMVSFWVTTLGGAIVGIAVSVIVSLVYLLVQTSRPANSILGRLPGTRDYRNIKRFPMAKEIPGIRIFRFDSSLHFANKDFFEARLKALEESPHMGVPVHTVVLDASSINQLDASAIGMLIQVATMYQERGLSLLCANWKGPQRDLLDLSGFYDFIPPADLFLGLHDAVVEARKRARTREPEEVDPDLPPDEDEEIGHTMRKSSTSRDPETVVEINAAGVERAWKVGYSDSAQNSVIGSSMSLANMVRETEESASSHQRFSEGGVTAFPPQPGVGTILGSHSPSPRAEGVEGVAITKS